MTSGHEIFHEIDTALADRVCAWFKSDDPLLWQSIAAVSFALQQGHSCLKLDECQTTEPYCLLEEHGGLAFPPVNDLAAHLSQFDLSPNGTSPIVFENNRLYLRRYWAFEQSIAEFFKARLTQPRALTHDQRKRAKITINELFPKSRPEQIDLQKTAALNTLFSNISVIIGGPGTGKTYTVTRILALLASIADQPLTIQLAAPTGKAAARLAEAIREAKDDLPLDMLTRESIPDTAQTLHRLLGVIPKQLNFRHNEDNPIDADVLLVDEVSMVDLPLMTRLCRAIGENTHVIFLGDANQLPSVAAGSVLADLISSPHSGYSQQRIKALKSIDSTLESNASAEAVDYGSELIHSRRFNSDSGIGQLAKSIIQGNVSESFRCFDTFADVSWISYEHLAAQEQTWVEIFRNVQQAESLSEAFDLLKKFRILCALREGPAGVELINERISAKLNRNRTPYFKGQPIMVTENHYGLQLFNGDIGLVWPDKSGQLLAWFETDGEARPVALGRLPKSETVFAMTIHKTQGSEFEDIALLLPDKPTPLVTRELLYTGLTRAKKRVTYVGTKFSWTQGVKTCVERWAGLADKLSTSLKTNTKRS